LLIQPCQEVGGADETTFGGSDLALGEAAGALVVPLCAPEDHQGV
jgi:hypothetical protein